MRPNAEDKADVSFGTAAVLIACSVALSLSISYVLDLREKDSHRKALLTCTPDIGALIETVDGRRVCVTLASLAAIWKHE